MRQYQGAAIVQVVQIAKLGQVTAALQIKQTHSRVSCVKALKLVGSMHTAERDRTVSAVQEQSACKACKVLPSFLAFLIE